MGLTLTPLAGIPLIQPGDDLAKIILSGLDATQIHLEDGDILVLAQKIVSKAEGRLVNLAGVTASPRAIELARNTEKDPRLVEVILSESNEVLRTRPGTIIVEHRLGFVCASAGVDHSNVSLALDPEIKGSAEEYFREEWVLLLPVDPDASASLIREGLEVACGKRLGVLIIDSHGRAWRLGTVGVAIGISGLPGLVDLRGTPDLAGYVLKITLVAAADELAAAASLVMGQAAEGTPIVHVRGFPYPLREGNLNELLRPRQEDMFR
jgi:coenzyme F420-0:L-glutamate ligase/coenzyme F420-1:gamma-L-glutamate ligase